MKYPVFLLFFILICSCDDAVEKAVKARENDSLQYEADKQRLLMMLEGGWVGEDYISKLRKTNSPMSACSPFGGQELTFTIGNLEGDTLFNAAQDFLQTEERFNIIFYRKKDGKAGMKRDLSRLQKVPGMNYSEMLLDFSFEGHDSALVCTGDHDWGGAITKRFHHQYGKIPTRDSIVLRPIEYAVNENLFAGDWLLKGKIISFSTNGGVKNFKSFTRYSVVTTAQNPEYQPDIISFYNGIEKEAYVFTMLHGRMQLYEFTQGEFTFSRGKMVYELTRT